MKILTCSQIRDVDAYTILHEPVSSIDLMERAAGKLFGWITARFGREMTFAVFAGPGNNGGDGLALTRMLTEEGYNVKLYYVKTGGTNSPDWVINMRRLESLPGADINFINEASMIPVISADVVIDAIFGSGLSRPLTGLAAEVIEAVNAYSAVRIAVDIPSGLFCENNSGNYDSPIFRADYTLCFQFPRLSFMFPENFVYTGEWEALPIGLHEEIINETKTSYNLIGIEDVRKVLKKRSKFDHKGIYGHGLLIAGSYGKMGAAILSAGAALRSGIGLLTCHVPECGYGIMQTNVPEAMVVTDSSYESFSDLIEPDNYSAAAIGPGLARDTRAQQAFGKFLESWMKPIVIDADGLNILSENKNLLRLIRQGTILTPHPKEFARLAGESECGSDRLEKQIAFSQKHNCIVILKGAHTSVSMSDGSVWFNYTGNPGMATAGSGDVLTGMILGLLAQGYGPAESALLAVFLHGTAGDIAASGSSEEAMVASDIIYSIGKAFNKIRDINS